MQSRSDGMRGWQIQRYGGIEVLHLNNDIPIPKITSPNEVLVEVYTTSINPLDVMMMGTMFTFRPSIKNDDFFFVADAYGSKILNLLRWKTENSEFPLILGVEFYGVVRMKGRNVSKNINIDDKVYGVSVPQRGGCHAEYVVVDQSSVS